MHCLESHSQPAIPPDPPSDNEGAGGPKDPVGAGGRSLLCFPLPLVGAPSSFCASGLVLMGNLQIWDVMIFGVAGGLGIKEGQWKEVVTCWSDMSPTPPNEFSSNKYQAINTLEAFLFI